MEEDKSTAEAPEKITIAFDDIPVRDDSTETKTRKRKGGEEYEISESSRAAREKQEQMLVEMMMQKRANAIPVPTNDAAVRSRLRELEEPMTVFGEKEMERRDRLRKVLAKLEADGKLPPLEGATEQLREMAAIQKTSFYTEGLAELRRARIGIVQYSLPNAAKRIADAKRKKENPDEDEEAEVNYVLNGIAQISMACSEIGDDRSLSACAFSPPDSTLLATSGWTGNTFVWKVPNVEKVASLKGHTERMTDVVFSPSGNHIATASADRTAILWDVNGVRRVTFQGHLDRLGRIAFHPTGEFLGTTSFDKTWRLWDINTGTELQLQEGHSRSVYAIAFQCDGALVATGGMDALARIWDLRTGRSILALEGHVKAVLGMDFSPNGYHLATGSEDHTCKIWDIRKKRLLYTIPAHSSLISQVKYERRDGHFLVTSSHDQTAKIWSGRDFRPVKTLKGHEGRVSGVDISFDGECIATVAHDRTIKLWYAANKQQQQQQLPDYGDGDGDSAGDGDVM